MHQQFWPLLVDIQESNNASITLPVDYPDARVLAAFFLGCVFSSGTQHLMRSSFLHRVLHKVGGFFRSSHIPVVGRSSRHDLEASFINGASGKPWRNEHRPDLNLAPRHNNSALVFTLNLSLVLSSLATLLSIFNYGHLDGSETLCAFVIAWGGMAARLTRLIGFIIIITDLGWRSINIVETWSLWAMLSIALAFNFAFNATNTGSTKGLANTDAVYCYRRQYLATALASSVTHFVIEFYLLARSFWIQIPRGARLRERLVGSKWFCVARICSLIVFDALTVVPDAISTNLFAQFIPFSVGALVVLTVFNYKIAPAHSPLPSMIVSSNNSGAKPRPVSDLLAPTPFTLHFDGEDQDGPVDPHSWSSGSLHPHPSTSSRRPSHTSTTQTGSTSDLASAQEAVISKASTAWRRSVKKLHLNIPFTIPRSAPAYFSTFVSSAKPSDGDGAQNFPHKIVQSQVAFAARLEREDSSKAQAKTKEPPRGLTMPPMSQDHSHGTIHTDSESSCSTIQAMTPGSAIYGSDIIQITSDRRRADGGAQHSPTALSMSTFFSPTSHRSTRRFSSTPSWRTVQTSSSSSRDGHERINPPQSRRHSQGLLSPESTASHRARVHYSFSSVRSARRDELPTVREMSPDAGLSLSAASVYRSTRSRRTTFGAGPSSFAARRTKRDAVTDIVVPVPTPQIPMPPVLAHFPSRPRSRSEASSPPNLRLLPATPERRFEARTESFIDMSPSPPADMSPRSWQERPMNGKVKGPRPPPSALSLTPSSGWPLLPQDQEPVASLSRSASRRSSLPSLDSYSQESARSRSERQRPST